MTLPILFAVCGAAGAIACSVVGEDDVESADSNLTDMELATNALKILGAPQVPRESPEPASCHFTGCHSINTVSVKEWADHYSAAIAFLESDKPKEEKINWFRENPQNTATSFDPERVGIMAAGVHLALGANVSEARHPETYKQGKLLAELFEGNDALYAEFRRAMLMPVNPEFPRLTPSQYETILTWFKKGLPHLEEIIREDRPTVCTDDFERLRARTSAVKSKTWAARNFLSRLPMIGCPPPDPENPVSPTRCFEAQVDGKDIFPKAADVDYGKGWAQDGSTIRILRDLSSPNRFWVRTSADGRFVATGGGRTGGAQAIDLLATLEGRSRDIGLQASFDPDFWPDNKAFMFQSGTKYCSQSLLEKPETTLVTFGEPECNKLVGPSGLYQTVGQVVGDNSISDRFILYSVWAGDSGGYNVSARDKPPKGGEDSAIEIFTAVAQGNDVEDGYQVAGEGFKIPTPYRGDTMMGRSGRLVGSRWAYGAPDGSEVKAAGYAIEELDFTVASGRYRFQLAPLGNVCIRGNKANFSYDERFLSSYHYNEPSEFTDEDDPAYREKGSADVWVVDFVTGKKQKVTKMGPGQFAMFPHFRSDGWLHFLAVDQNTQTYRIVASDWAIRQTEAAPTP